MLVSDVLYQFHTLNNWGFEFEELDELTVKQLADKFEVENHKRYFVVKIPFIGGPEADIKKWNKLNDVSIKATNFLNKEGIKMGDIGSGYGGEYRDYYFQFENLDDREKYRDIINDMFEEVL